MGNHWPDRPRCAHDVVHRASRRSAAGVVALLVLLLTTGWVLLPRQVDVHESFIPRPNDRSSCTGWSFRHHPPGTFDASTRVYCVGLETSPVLQGSGGASG